MNGKRRLHGTTLFLDTTHAGTLRGPMGLPLQPGPALQRSVIRLVKELGDMRLGHNVRQLELPKSSKIVPRPALVVRRSSTPGSP